MKSKSAPASQGYTLIELLIILVITGTLFTIGYNGFQSYSRQQTLLSLARSIQVDLRSAQNSAIIGSKPSTCNAILNGYQFNVISATKYEIDAYCSVNKIQTKLVTLPADLTISIPAPNPITFKSLSQGTNIASGGTATIQITQISTGNKRSVTIGANGNIQ